MKRESVPAASLAALDESQLEQLLSLYPWFTAARMCRQSLSAKPDPLLGWFAADRHLPEAEAPIDVEALLHLSSEDLIDRFLKEKELRIVAEEGEVTEEIVTEASLEDEDDLVSEDLAEVYLRQGLKEEALAIYRRLCLLNPEKSVYFAEIIQRIETNN